MRRAGVAFAAFGLCAACAGTPMAADAPGAGRVELTLPRATAPGEEAWLRIRAGALPKGAKLRVSTSEGKELATIAPFGAQASQVGGGYTVPLPKGAVSGGRASVRIEVIDAAGASRAPAASEVEGIELINVPVSR